MTRVAHHRRRSGRALRMRTFGLAALVACTSTPTPTPTETLHPSSALVAPPPIIAPYPTGTKRVVRHRWDSAIQARDIQSGPDCRRLELTETVVAADATRELELDVVITGGDNDTLCEVGRSFHLVGNGKDVKLTETGGTFASDPGRDLAIRDRVWVLHKRLGQADGPFHLLLDVPTDKLGELVFGGATWQHGTSSRSDNSDNNPLSESHTSKSAALWVRADHHFACATAEMSLAGSGEYGGFSQTISESLTIDDAQSPSPCPYKP